MRVNGMLLKKYFNFFSEEDKLYVTIDNDNLTISGGNTLFFIPVIKQEDETIEGKAYSIVDNKELNFLKDIKSKRIEIEIKLNQKTIILSTVKPNGETQENKIKVEEVKYLNPIVKNGIPLDSSLFLPFIQISNLMKENENIDSTGKIRLAVRSNGFHFDTLDLFENVTYDETKVESSILPKIETSAKREFDLKALTKPLTEIAKMIEISNLYVWFNSKELKLYSDDFRIRVKFSTNQDINFVFKNIKEGLNEIKEVPKAYLDDTSDQVSFKQRKMNFLIAPMEYENKERFMVFQKRKDNKTFQYIISKKRS